MYPRTWTALLPVLSLLVILQAGPCGAQDDQTGQGLLWQAAPAELPTELVVLEGGPLVGVGVSRITSWDPENGGTRWWMDREGAEDIIVEAAGGPRVLVGRGSRGSYRVDVVDDEAKEVLWGTGRRQGELWQYLVVPEENRLFLLERSDSGEGRIVVRDLLTGDRFWQTPAGPLPARGETGVREGTSRMVLAGSRLIRVDGGEHPAAVSAHDPGTGDLRWLSFLRGAEGVPGLLVHPAGLFTVGEDLRRMDPENGALMWRMEGRWLPTGYRSPWLRVEEAGSGRIQLLHGATGEERWGEPADPGLEEGGRTRWTQEGILAVGADGEAVLFDVSNGRRAQRHSARYTLDPEREPVRIWAAEDGVIAVRGGREQTVLLRLDGRGSVRWRQEAGPPVQRFATAEEGARRLYGLTLDADGGPGVVWAAVMQAGGAELGAWDVQSGERVVSLPVLRDGVVFAADGVARRVYLLTPERRLAAAGY